MKKSTIFFVFVCVLITQGRKYCDNLGVLIYDEIGCKADFAKGGCPSSYNCSNYIIPEDSCRFKRTNYKDKQVANGTTGCNKGCVCQADGTQRPNFFCGLVIDCIFHTIKPECYFTSTLNACCSSQRCPPFNNTVTCKSDGKIYRDGEIFFPKNTCWKCRCQKDYRGRYEKPYCIRTQCDVELRHGNDIVDNCAIVYRNGETNCCPIEFICPVNTLVLDLKRSGISNCKEKRCKFGNKEFKLQDKMILQTNNTFSVRNVSCSCILPPLLTCKLN